jgi:predicted O-methyltransferase YrrM
MVEDVTVRELGIKRVAPRHGAKKFKYGLMAREVPVFCGLVQQLAPRRAVEIGTWWGLGAERILEMSPGCQVITIDYQDRKSERPPELGSPDPAITYLVEDSRTVRLPADWYGGTDLVFVDGDHQRDGVVSDTRLALSLVAPGGMIIWHDVLELGSVKERAKGLRSKHRYYVSEYLYRRLPLTVMRIERTALGVYRHPPDA